MKRLVGFLLIIVIIAGCTHDKPLPSGYELLDRGNKGELIVKTYPAVRSGNYWTTPLSGGYGTLFLGEYKSFKSYILLRFVNFTVIDTAIVKSATLNLHQILHYDEGDSFNVSIYKVKDPWLPDVSDEKDWEKTVVWKDIQNIYDAAKIIGTLTVGPQDSAKTISTKLDTTLVNEWINSKTNYGLLMAFDKADIMAEFYSSESSSKWPTIEVIHVKKSGTLDTTIVNAYQDASLFQFDTPIPENTLQTDLNNLAVGNVSGFKSLIQFDLSNIPENATIHHAQLDLSVNKDLSKTFAPGIPILAVPVLDDSTWDLSKISLYSLNASPSSYARGDTVKFSYTHADAVQKMSFIIQRWVLKSESIGMPNYGLLLQSSVQGGDLSEISFYSGKDDSTTVPKLRVTYSLPPVSRFSE